ncbi:MAG: S8 family serine peptidase [Bdellovibrionaceae bacterium]|nr:S8 family serine peptidase [Pseudobdellovibrionaceae bacterium]
MDDKKFKDLFNLAVRDSGCVMVGAVDSPKYGRVRQRSGFSNYGTRIDAFGYGEDVVTAGYGDLYDGTYQSKLATYTQSFSGTSSAAPIVAGAVASILGIAKQKGLVISPLDMRKALRQTGTKQEGAATENVGTMPNIPELLKHLRLTE